jgi:negative regulator of sigma E activity
MSELNTKTCSQAENLVAYLYGEATEAEKKIFERHLSACDSCRDELAAFGMVRESVVTWRDEMLSSLVAPAVSQNIAPVIASANTTRKRSALAAIREFFSLSPVWLQSATAFAAIAFLALAVFAAIQLVGKKEEIVEKPENKAVEKKDDVANKGNGNSTPNDKIQPKSGGKDDRERVVERKPVKANRDIQQAKLQRRLKKQQSPRLIEQELTEILIVENKEDNSLRLSSMLETIND